MASRLMLVAVAAWVWTAAGCATKPEVVASSGPRPPTQPDQVKIYQKPPLKYERHGLISMPIRDDEKWDANGNADAAFERLKVEAAKRGANGLLLAVEGKDHGLVTVGYQYKYYQVPIRRAESRTVLAEAIYVLKDY